MERTEHPIVTEAKIHLQADRNQIISNGGRITDLALQALDKALLDPDLQEDWESLQDYNRTDIREHIGYYAMVVFYNPNHNINLEEPVDIKYFQHDVSGNEVRGNIFGR